MSASTSQQIENLRRGIVAAASLLLAVGIGIAQAQDYPFRPIRLVVAFAPGGATDFAARLIADKVKGILGQSVIVENRPGANGAIAAENVARSEPDGYSLFFTTVGAVAVNPHLRTNLAYDPIADFEPVAMVVRYTILLAVNAKLKAKDARVFAAMAKEKPRGVTVGVTGIGATSHLGLELFQAAAGVEFQAVPYHSGAQALNDVLGGQIDGILAETPVLLSQLKAGNIRALGTTSRERSNVVPEVQTFIEQGFADVVSENWSGVLAPAHTPPAIIAKLNAAFTAAVNDPDVRQKLALSGVTPFTSTPEEFGRVIRGETERWGQIIRAKGIKTKVHDR